MAKIISLLGFERELLRFPDRSKRAAIRGLQSAAMLAIVNIHQAIDETKPFAPVDNGSLKNSVNMLPTQDGAEVFADAPHAPYVEHGTRPHWPPMEPILQWVIRKGLAADDDEAEEIAYRVRLHIAMFGTEPRHFFKRGMDQTVKHDVPQEIMRELKEEFKGG